MTNVSVSAIRPRRFRVSPDGRTEAKATVPASLCAGLGLGASKPVPLPDIRFGVRNEAPRTVARGQIEVAAVERPFEVKLGGGIPQVIETVTRLGPGESRYFVAPRREGRTIQVTSFQVPAKVRAPTPASGSSGGVMVITQPSSANGAHLVCVSDILFGDPAVHVTVDVEAAIAEKNETNSRKGF